MLLRESGEQSGTEIGLLGVIEGGDAGGVRDADVLLAFTEAIVRRDRAATAEARAALAGRMGEAAMVDAAAVAANFERMTRIADATGIPLGERLEEPTAHVREELGLGRFARA
jgi:hypothetical protein